MSDQSVTSPTPESGPALEDRVRRRVARAAAVLAGRDASTARSIAPPSLTRDERALRLVFRDLGKTHREYRVRNGLPVSLPLRDAARAFKQEPSLVSLVPVAGFLDKLQLLDW